MKELLLVILTLVPPIFGFAQIEYTNAPPMTAEEMAQKILGDGVEIFNVKMLCGDDGAGYFWNGNTTNLGMESGIVLTTGKTNLAFGPNDTGSASGSGGPGFAPLEDGGPAIHLHTFNACVLEFDFISYGSEINLNYLMGSEEYPEWVGSQWNDVFALIVQGEPEYPAEMPLRQKNIAIIPGSPDPGVQVAINFLNLNAYSEYYVDNTGGLHIQYDGFTVPLPAYASVTPCNTYHLTLAVADVGDAIYDTGLFFEENSFQSSVPQVQSISTNLDENSQIIVENCSEAIVTFSLGFVPLEEQQIPIATTPLEGENLQILIGGTATQKDDFLLASGDIVFPAKADETDLFPEIPLHELRIIPVADNIDEETEYITIGVYSACNEQYLSMDTIRLEDELKAEVMADIGICTTNTPVTLWAMGGESYHWFPSDDLDCPNCPNPTVTVSETTTFFVNIEKANCVEQRSMTVFVEESLQTATLEEEHFVCADETISLEATGGLSYEWEGIGGSTVEDLSCTNCPNPIFTPSDAGTFSYSVEIMSGDNCSETLTTTIHVEQLELEITASSSNLCQDESQTLTAIGSSENYIWTNSSGEVIAFAPSVEVNPENYETYTATTQGIHCSQSESIFVEACHLEAVIEATSNFICKGESTTLTAIGEGEHIWLDSDNNILGTGNNLTVAPTENTTYQLQASQGTFTDVAEIVIAVEPELTIQIMPENPTLCGNDDEIELEIINPIEGVVYQWEEHPDLTIYSEGTRVRASPDSEQTFSVQALSPAGCLLSKEVTVQVGGELQLSIDVPEVICMDLAHPEVFQINAYGADCYSWNPLGPLLSNPCASQAIFVPNPANNEVIFSVTGTDEEGLCEETLEFQVEVLQAPDVSIAINGLCTDEVTILEATVEGGSGNFEYEWLPVNGLSHPNSRTTTAMIEGEASYTLVIRDLDIGCEMTETVEFQKTDIQVLSPTYFRFCEPEQATTFEVDGSFGATYRWFAPDGNELEETEGLLTVYPTESGVYTVEATTFNGCQKTIDFEVDIVPTPFIDITEVPEIVCSGHTFVLELEGLNEYHLQSTNNTSFYHQFIAPNQVEIVAYENLELEISGMSVYGCPAQTQISIAVSSVEVPIPFEVDICGEGGTAILKVDGGMGATYDWQPPIGLSSTSTSSVEVSPSNIDFYTVQVVTAAGCEETIGFDVTPRENPEVVVNPSFTEVCQGDTVRLELSGALTYEFIERSEKPFELLQLSDEEVEIIANDEMEFYIIGSDAFGCESALEIALQIDIIGDVVQIEEPSPFICFGESIELSINAGEGASYNWFPTTSMSDSTISNPIVNPEKSTAYHVEVVDIHGCESLHTIIVAVSDEITANLLAIPDTLCAQSNNAIVLQAGHQPNTTYTFFDESGEVITQNSTSVTIVVPTETTTYSVLVENEDGCTVTDEVTVWVEELQVEVPEQLIVCTEESISISPTSNFSNLSYQWSPNIGISDPTIPSPTFFVSETQTYSLIVTNDMGCADTVQTTIEVTNDCVFPGDADNNGTVDMFDLFPLGQHFGKQEFARNRISNDWQGFGVWDWSETQSNGQNTKYADCNGNGTIGFEDTTAILQNFELQQKSSYFSKGKLGDPELRFVPNHEAIGVGEELQLEVWIGSTENPVTDLYAIAFETFVNVDLIDLTSISIDYSPNQLGMYGEDLLAVDWIDTVNGRINISLSQTNGIGANGEIHLLTLRMRSKPDLENPENLTFTITDFGATDSNETPILANLDELPAISIDPDVVNIEATNFNSKPYTLYPSFTQNGFFLQYHLQQNPNMQVKLFDLSGQLVGDLWHHVPSNVGSFEQYIDLIAWNLAAGVYIVELEVDGVVYQEKIVFTGT